MMKYKVTKDDRQKFVTMFLLDRMINFQEYFSVLLEGDNKYLENDLIDMSSKGFIEVKDTIYTPTTKGREVVEKFLKRYWEYLKVYDLYCAVDLDEGVFAFTEFFNMKDDDWINYLDEKRWSDVRIAVCEEKKMDPMEIVFMSFINEGKFDEEKWQFDLYSDELWQDIAEICNTAIFADDLRENDAITDIIDQGSKLMVELIKQEEEQDVEDEPESDEEEDEPEYFVEIIEETHYDIDYYESYYDPYYVSPIWVDPYWYW